MIIPFHTAPGGNANMAVCGSSPLYGDERASVRPRQSHLMFSLCSWDLIQKLCV